MLAATFVLSLSVGRYHVPAGHVIAILTAKLLPLEVTWSATEARVVELIRLPRVLVAAVCGAGLAVAGAALQGIFRNPLVGPQVLGVTSGAAFGGALAILTSESALLLVALAFVFGLAAMGLVYALSMTRGRAPVLILVLSGIVVGALFSALVALIKFVADPDDKLPTIVFWLMGSFAAASMAKLALVAVVVGAASALVYLLRFRINVLSLGDEEARSLGLRVELVRWTVFCAVALICAAVVSVAGIVGWVGLVIPHIARRLTGPDHRKLIPAAALVGAIYLMIVDDVARTVAPAEIPIGILTALIGAPVFALLLRRAQSAWTRD
ncbi:MAG: iron ABC transporter permease [Pseudomonadota bacterium]